MLRRTENAVRSVSNPLENQKTRKITLPTPWKNGKRSQEHFQPLGKPKNAENCVSNPLEERKMPLAAFPTPWKDFFNYKFYY